MANIIITLHDNGDGTIHLETDPLVESPETPAEHLASQIWAKLLEEYANQQAKRNATGFSMPVAARRALSSWLRGGRA